LHKAVEKIKEEPKVTVKFVPVLNKGARHVARMRKMRNAYNILIGKSEW
jgi:hypothetical protein